MYSLWHCKVNSVLLLELGFLEKYLWLDDSIGIVDSQYWISREVNWLVLDSYIEIIPNLENPITDIP